MDCLEESGQTRSSKKTLDQNVKPLTWKQNEVFWNNLSAADSSLFSRGLEDNAQTGDCSMDGLHRRIMAAFLQMESGTWSDDLRCEKHKQTQCPVRKAADGATFTLQRDNSSK